MNGTVPSAEWERCGAESGCTGIAARDNGGCLAHLDTDALESALRRFADGDCLDARGVTFSEELLERVVAAAPTGSDGRRRLHRAKLERAIFAAKANFGLILFGQEADFSGAIFQSEANFDDSIFDGVANFSGATFRRRAWFRTAVFGDAATFDGATFEDSVEFRNACFRGNASFRAATFERGPDTLGGARFHEATFCQPAEFEGAVFHARAGFRHTQFCSETNFSAGLPGKGGTRRPAAFEGYTTFDDAVFSKRISFGGVTFEQAPGFERTTFSEQPVHEDGQVVVIPAGRAINFERTSFKSGANFKAAMFHTDASFGESRFLGNTDFNAATFAGTGDFKHGRFEGAVDFTCAHLAEAAFQDVVFDEAAAFGEAEFKRKASFARARFHGPAEFPNAVFCGDALFCVAPEDSNAAGPEGVRFEDTATFRGTRFNQKAAFSGAVFAALADFRNAEFPSGIDLTDTTFKLDGWFDGTAFDNHALIERGTFEGDASFTGARFRGREADLKQVTFKGPSYFDSAEFAVDTLTLDSASFAQAVALDVNARQLLARHARFGGPATIRVRRAMIALDGTEFAQPSTLAKGGDNATIAGRPHLISLRGANVADLVVSNLDLKSCRFDGAHNLSRLRIEGVDTFARSPRSYKGAQRMAIAEEHEWRKHHPHRLQSKGWYAGIEFPKCWPDKPRELKPHEIAGIYRDLRKAREDNKDEPGAADFYYGEMEMRRYSDRTPRAERAIVRLYWLVSGYGLRASRAVAALLATILIFALLFWWRGFSPAPTFTRALLFSAESTSSLFRVPETPATSLTEAGEGMQIAVRLLGPLFIGLALVSLRGRVKR
jgi:hypothetical protein